MHLSRIKPTDLLLSFDPDKKHEKTIQLGTPLLVNLETKLLNVFANILENPYQSAWAQIVLGQEESI